MNRLYIISATELKGNSFGNMDLHLSSGQFKVITSTEDAKKYYFKGGIAIHHSDHPLDSIEITNTLKSMDWLILEDFESILKGLNDIIGLFQQFNSFYSMPSTRLPLNTHVQDMTRNRLSSMGLTSERGFEYDIVVSTQNGISIRPSTPRMEIIVNLIKGMILNLE